MVGDIPFQLTVAYSSSFGHEKVYRKNVLDLVVTYLVADFKNDEHYQEFHYFYVLFYRLESQKQGINKKEMVRISIF